MTYNIHHGAGLDGRVDLLRIADLIVGEAADVAFLQEVDRGLPRSDRLDLGWELARLTHMHLVFGKNADVAGGDYGTAMLSTRPLSAQRNVHLPNVYEGEQRGVLIAEVVVEGRTVLLMNVHADNRNGDSQRVLHMARIAELADGFAAGPVVLAGDFNDLPGSRTYAALERSFVDVWATAGRGDGFTFPARRPRRRIDYLWVRGIDVVAPQRAWVPASDASDHLPLMAEFAVVPP